MIDGSGIRRRSGLWHTVQMPGVAATPWLLVAGVDVSAAGADTAVEQGALLARIGSSLVVVMVPIAGMMAVAEMMFRIARLAVAVITLVIIRHRRCRTQVIPTSTAAT